MKAMFPTNQSQGLSASSRALLIAGGAVVVAAALVLYRGEVRAEARTILVQLQDVPVIGDYVPHPVVHHTLNVALRPVHPGMHPGAKPGATTAATPASKPGAPGAAAAATAQVAANQKSATTPTAGVAQKPGAAAVPAAKPGAPTAGGAVAVQAGRPATPTAANPAPTVTVAGLPASARAGAAQKPALTSHAAPKDSASAPIMREVFTYDKEARRDPFFSLMKSGELRPGISDLNLMGILYDESGRRPVAIMRDKTTDAQYRVTTGQQLGRMRVAQIKRKVIVFTIEEFGMNRQDSLVLGDSTKARAR